MSKETARELIVEYGVREDLVRAHEANGTLEELKLFVLSEGTDQELPMPELKGQDEL